MFSIKTAILWLCLLLFLGSALPADSDLPHCRRCSQEVISGWWQHCPRCGTKLPRWTIYRKDLLEDETILGNIYFNKPYNFKIERPHEKWKIKIGDQAKKFNRDALVVMSDRKKKAFAMMLVDEGMVDTTLEEYLELIKPEEDKTIKDVTIISKNKVMINDNEALQAEFEVKLGGTEFRFVYYLLEGRDKYQLILWCAKKYYQNAQESFELLKNSFDFIDKESKEEPVVPPVEEKVSEYKGE